MLNDRKNLRLHAGKAILGYLAVLEYGAVQEVDEPVYFQIAERSQLREFLMKHYPVPQFIAQYSDTM